jgi:hypothetical protein
MPSQKETGSSAEVERLWSVAKYILTDHRKRLTPQLFEALLFLKQNKDFWGLTEVVEAIRMERSVGRAEVLARNHLNELQNLEDVDE